MYSPVSVLAYVILVTSRNIPFTSFGHPTL
nr:MAG TPA: hypothetical protein [Caudoviricetes sp.]DAO49466.1 MAG TPA: hypothetical protein [Caudoviricetes sp.]